MLTMKFMHSTNEQNILSLTYISKLTGLSMATIYRKALDLIALGLINKVDRGHYIVTTKGAFLLVVFAINGYNIRRDALEASIKRLKEDWGLTELSDEEVINYIKLLIN
ncbi:hypothetical protein [Vulcanisaeta thermophila]|uniref:hypothetical protein n=1 Tax=Vulcanisaeta thermophila TaxID=867917 RepID=UPI00117E4488|nr:hypothetical protein [Vulcanisaeta thermophila]